MSQSRSKGVWEGPIPKEIMECADMHITKRFKQLIIDAASVQFMRPGKGRDKKIKDLNDRLRYLISEAKEKNAVKENG